MAEDMQQFLQATRLLDHGDVELVRKRGHVLAFATGAKEKVQKLYAFVTTLPLGYSVNDDVPASRVLRDGYGQCNTKVILLMALCRGAGIPCRVHAYRITKEAQRGRMPDWLLFFAPPTTLFTWPEFHVNGKWQPLQNIVKTIPREWHSCPFDGAQWQLEPLKKEWIVEDHGVWPSQDEYFRKHQPSVSGWRKIGWMLVGRRVLNKRAC